MTAGRRCTAFLAISATIAALGLSACGGSSRSSASSPVHATFATAANPVQRENARPGTPGWQIPAGAGTMITGFASEISVAPGQSFHLHVAAPPGSRYRVLVYRLGWYRGIGGRLVMCLPGCRSSRAAITQPPPTAPDSGTGLFRAPWRVTDRVEIPPDAVSGYYEAKLEIVSGAHTGAVGSVPLIVRQNPAAPASAVLVQVPVNTWEAYNPWGGKSLYQFGTSRHAVAVSFDRPFDQREFHNMVTDLELPWVRFLERNGIDVSYQADVDTDVDPGSLPRHRLVFSTGHDEYWTQQMRDAFDRALAQSTNLMFGSNNGEWRMRYADGRRTIMEWRDPTVDPRHENGYFTTFGEPECKLMATEHQWAAQRDIAAPPTSYTVVGPSSDPWLAAAGLKPGDVIPGVVGYEWDSFIPGCFAGRVVPLMTTLLRGSDGVIHSADMVRATAPSGGRVFAMGTMQLAWALDDLAGRSPDPRIVALVKAALRDLTRPGQAPPSFGKNDLLSERTVVLHSVARGCRYPKLGDHDEADLAHVLDPRRCHAGARRPGRGP
ncbi:MAG TPA: N,N-dimethylformamidase beta subunit family domain-containing protein [Streptosporangiaceae bacterium]|nr:N,N-dimethylformamidase beta subunit family domain-containing protein [Streptosporangiaceae bacterium]